ncbi:MAG: hypothetical protein SF053_18830 [Bacteroidia bacterium]|nr:hypothetical protein [Bacteroidia bacterium]
MRQMLMLIGLLGFVLSPLAGQNGGRIAFLQFPKIKATTMLVVEYEGQPQYNETIRQAVTQYWTLTPYKFISAAELTDYVKDDTYSMLVLDSTEKARHGVERTDIIKRNHLALYLCGKGLDMRNYGGKAALTQFQFRDAYATEEYLYKLPGLVQAMHDYLLFLNTQKITEDNHDKKYEAWRNRDVATLANVALYVVTHDLPEDLRDETQLRSWYQYDLQLVTPDEVATALAQQKPDIAFLHIAPNVTDLYIISAQGGKVLYHATPTIRGQFTKQDWVRLAARIKAAN